MIDYYFIVDSRSGRIDSAVPGFNQEMDPPYVQILATDEYKDLAKKIFEMELRASDFVIDLEKPVLTILSKDESLKFVDNLYNSFVEIPFCKLDYKITGGLELQFGNDIGSRYLEIICHEDQNFISRIKETVLNVYITAPNDIHFLYEQFCFNLKDFEKTGRVKTSVNYITNDILYNRNFTIYYRKKFSQAFYKLL